MIKLSNETTKHFAKSVYSLYMRTGNSLTGSFKTTTGIDLNVEYVPDENSVRVSWFLPCGQEKARWHKVQKNWN